MKSAVLFVGVSILLVGVADAYMKKCPCSRSNAASNAHSGASATTPLH